MRGLLTKIFRPNVEGMESGPSHSIHSGLSFEDRIPEVAGMIWEEELKKDRRKAEWYAFLCGVASALAVVFFVAFFVVRLTGGAEVCP